MKRIILAALVGVLLGACDETYSEQAADFVEHVEKHRLGDGPDYWLEERGNISGDWHKVAFFFGFTADGAVCQQYVESDKKAGTIDEFRCVPAN